MRFLVLEGRVVAVERDLVILALRFDEKSLLEMGGTRANLLGRHLHLLAEIVQKSRHARGLFAITLRLAEAIPLCTAQEGDGEEEDDDEVAIARDETVAKILDDGNEQREKHEKRHAVPYSVVDLTVLHNVSIGIELQEKHLP